MRICVLGNSQMAVLKLGWEQIGAEYPGLELQFFGASGARMADLRREGRLLVPGDRSLANRIAYTSGGARQVDLAAFDAVLLVGLNYSLPLPLDPRLSSAVRHEAVAGGFAATLCGHLLALVREADPEVPVYIKPNPLRRRPQNAGALWPDYPAYATRLAQARGVIEAFPGGPVRLVGQPAGTLLAERYTADAYGIGAMGLDQGNGPRPKGAEDITHMNAAYGIAFLQHWLPGLPA